MFELMVDTTFAAAHQLRGYKGKCEQKLNDVDMAMDFHDLKELLNEVVAPLDHSFLNDIFPFTEKNPSSENIAKWIYDSLNKKLSDEQVQVSAVTVWESETAAATYYEN